MTKTAQAKNLNDMDAKEFFKQHDNCKLTTAQENGSYLLTKYVFELMESYHQAKSEEDESYLKRAVGLIEYFVKRVEAGTIRSKATYRMYREFLAAFRKEQS